MQAEYLFIMDFWKRLKRKKAKNKRKKQSSKQTNKERKKKNKERQCNITAERQCFIQLNHACICVLCSFIKTGACCAKYVSCYETSDCIIPKLGRNGKFFMSFGIQTIIQGPPILNSCKEALTLSSRSSTNNFQKIRHNLFFFYVRVTVHRNKLIYNEINQMH